MSLEALEFGETLGQQKFKDLMEDVFSQRMRPEDQYEIAATLESMGWNDRTAAETFGVEDVFELAHQMWDARNEMMLFEPAQHIEVKTLRQYAAMLFRGFLRGAIFALPMVVSVVSMLTLRFSLWSYINLSLENATSIAVGTIMSFVAVGGFTQSIAYWGFRFIGQDHYYMARKIVFYYVRLGYILCLAGALGFLVFNLLFSVFPWRMTTIVALYFLFLSAIWLSVTIMYMLRRELVFTALIISGIGLVFIFFKVLGFNIIISQVISLSITSLVGILLAFYYFYQAEKQNERGINPPLPRLSVLFHLSTPYFAYGLLYFLFIFVDRLIAWSTNEAFMPFLIWFRGEYELGLDFALIVLILPMGLIEALVTEFISNLEANQKQTEASKSDTLCKMYLSFYKKRIIYVALFSLFSALISYLAINKLTQGGLFGVHLVLSSATKFVFTWAICGYVLIAIALFNVLIMFCVSQPRLVHRSVLLASIVNIFLGFLLSRWFDYNWAIIGMVAGAAVFAVITTRQVITVLRKIDYYLYLVS